MTLAAEILDDTATKVQRRTAFFTGAVRGLDRPSSGNLRIVPIGREAVTGRAGVSVGWVLDKTALRRHTFPGTDFGLCQPSAVLGLVGRERTGAPSRTRPAGHRECRPSADFGAEPQKGPCRAAIERVGFIVRRSAAGNSWVCDDMSKYLFVLIVSLLGALVAGCGGHMLAAEDVSNTPLMEPPEYVIGPGDSLHIFVWDQPDLSTSVQVRPDGKISTPLVEDLQAAGRTPTQLARDIENVLSEFVRSPVVTVIVQGFVGEAAQQIRVVGQAVQPQVLQYRQGMTVLDVMIAVGGLTEYAAGNRARLIRRVGDEEVQIRVRLDDLLNDGDIRQNVRMMPGDVLVIPQSIL